MSKSLEELDVSSIKTKSLKKIINSVVSDYETLGATDQVSKGSDLLKAIKRRFS